MPTALESSPERPGGLVADGVDITQLSDDELYQRLKELGVSVGPVVGTTRSVYQRKLYHLMKGGHDSESDINFNADRFSDGEVDDGPMTPSTRHRTISRSNGAQSAEQVTIVYETPLVGLAAVPCPAEDADPYTPTPRRPLHSGRPLSDFDSASPRWRFGSAPSPSERSGVSVTETVSAPAAAPPKKSNTVYATCFEIFMLSFLFIVGYIFFQEIQTYSAAEKEYDDTDAQNFEHPMD